MWTKQLPTGVYVEEYGDYVRLYSLNETRDVLTLHAIFPKSYWEDAYPDGLPDFNSLSDIERPYDNVDVITDPGWDRYVLNPEGCID